MTGPEVGPDGGIRLPWTGQAQARAAAEQAAVVGGFERAAAALTIDVAGEAQRRFHSDPVFHARVTAVLGMVARRLVSTGSGRPSREVEHGISEGASLALVLAERRVATGARIEPGQLTDDHRRLAGELARAHPWALSGAKGKDLGPLLDDIAQAIADAEARGRAAAGQ